MKNIYNAIQNVYNMDKTTWQEVLVELYNLVSNVENKFDLFENKFGQLLGEEVTIELKKMYDDGSLINDKLLKDIKTEINEQLDTKTQQLENSKATKTEVDIERKRIDSFVKLEEGSTTGDAELIDARIGANGIVYDSVGAGIREQFKTVNNDILNIKSMNEYSYLENGFIENCYVSYRTGNVITINGQITTGFIDISDVIDNIIMNVPREVYQNIAFYDETKKYISGLASPNIVQEYSISIPKNAKYLRSSFFTEDRENFYLKGKLRLVNTIKTNTNLLLTNNNFNKYEFEIGTINPANGVTSSSTERIRTVNYISSNIVDLTINDDCDCKFMVFCYEKGNYLGVWEGIKNEFSTSPKWIKKCNLLDLKMWHPNIVIKIVIDTGMLENAEKLNITKERYTDEENRKKDNIDSYDFTYFIDGVNGNDDNDGSQSAPFKTITKALNENGNILYISGGTYKEPIYIGGKRKVVIKPSEWLYPYAENDLVERKKIILDFSEDINLINSSVYQGILECNYNAPTESYMYKVFIDKTLPVVNTENVTTHGDAYNCTLWEVYDNVNKGDYRLLPVLSIDECINTVGSFHYNGTKIYVNPMSQENENIYKLSGNNDVGVEIRGCKDVVIEDLIVKYSRGANFYLRDLDNVTFRGCEGLNASIRNGFRMMNVNGNFYGCKGNNNKADGIALHMFGRVDFFDCEAHWNGDDGISPHDGCFGSISNSIFSNNLKGGVSSVNGASYNLFNVISHNNEFGFLLTSEEGCKRRQLRLMNCVAYDNKTGICTSRNDFLVYNCKFVRNQLNKQIINTSTFVEVDNITD